MHSATLLKLQLTV